MYKLKALDYVKVYKLLLYLFLNAAIYYKSDAYIDG